MEERPGHVDVPRQRKGGHPPHSADLDKVLVPLRGRVFWRRRHLVILHLPLLR